MTDTLLLLPLAFMALGALIAGLSSMPTLNRRLQVERLTWLLALAPLGSFVVLLSLLRTLTGGEALTWSMDWVLSLGLRIGLYYDHLSALFALLVTGIGILVVIYAGYYFQGDQTAWRFLVYLFLFMFSMVGLVLAGDLISLFVFWEGTSITSFLLVAYKTKDESARRGAFQALLITAGGGVALLIGVLGIGAVAGSMNLAEVLSSGDLIRDSGSLSADPGAGGVGCLDQERSVPVSLLAARGDECAYAGQRIPALGHDGQSGHLFARPVESGPWSY